MAPSPTITREATTRTTRRRSGEPWTSGCMIGLHGAPSGFFLRTLSTMNLSGHGVAMSVRAPNNTNSVPTSSGRRYGRRFFRNRQNVRNMPLGGEDSPLHPESCPEKQGDRGYTGEDQKE